MSGLDKHIWELSEAFCNAGRVTDISPKAEQLLCAIANKHFTFAREPWHDVGASVNFKRSRFPTELLLRPHDHQGMFKPFEGIQDIYNAGMSVAFDKVIVSAADRLIHKSGPSVSVNISARSVKSTDFLRWIGDHLNPDHAAKTVFEITEDAPANNVRLAEIQRLKDAGYRFAVDDFSHTEPETRLRNLAPIADYVKIDGPSVEKGLQDPAFMRGLIHRIRTMAPEAILIAERVRTPMQALTLYDMGIEGVQQRDLPATSEIFAAEMQSWINPPTLKTSILRCGF